MIFLNCIYRSIVNLRPALRPTKRDAQYLQPCTVGSFFFDFLFFAVKKNIPREFFTEGSICSGELHRTPAALTSFDFATVRKDLQKYTYVFMESVLSENLSIGPLYVHYNFIFGQLLGCKRFCHFERTMVISRCNTKSTAAS